MALAKRSFPRLVDKPVWSFASDGTVFDLAAPDQASICFLEIGRALSGIYRFNGRGVSDAQHCVMGAQAILNEGGSSLLAALFLLHDAHEGLIGDIVRPMEGLLAAMLSTVAVRAAISHVKAAWDGPIYTAAGLPVPEEWTAQQRKLVKAMDDRMCAAEAIFVFGMQAAREFPRFVVPRTTGSFAAWMPGKAEEEFQKMLYRLIGEERVIHQAAIAAAARAVR